MIVGIPVIQLVLFGFAINSDPKHLPTALIDFDRSEFSRSIGRALANTDYFALRRRGRARGRGRPAAGARAKRSSSSRFPAGFARELVRGERPAVLVDADATDPMATGNAVAALSAVAQHGARARARRPAARRWPRSPARSSSSSHARYNPEAISQYNVVPGLIGVILTMTMVLITGLAITRERERGTMENLLSTPATALEVMTGKIVPYVVIGLVQVTLVLRARQADLRRADAGQPRRALCRGAAVHRGEPDARAHVLDRRARTSCSRCR